MIRRGFVAFNAADMAALGELIAEHAVQHMAGSNPVFTDDVDVQDEFWS